MSAPRTDKQKKKIIADYVRLQNYSAVARLNHVAWGTVKNIVQADKDFEKKCEEKREKNTADVLAYMDSQKDTVCAIIEKALGVIPTKMDEASLSQIATTMGIIIDKWALISGAPADKAKDDALSASLREMAAELKSDKID